MLVARVAVQHPRVVLVDADSDGALDVVARMRELPDADDIHVLFVARPGGAVLTTEEALAHEGSGLFVRPIDVPSLVHKVDSLTGGPQSEEPARAPPSAPATQKKRSSSPPSLPPASMRGPATGVMIPEPRASAPSVRSTAPRSSRAPSEPPASASPGGVRRVVGLSPPVSQELQQLLAEAEQRVQVQSDHESLVPSPEDEIEAVLPAELLASFDEPLEEDEDDDEIGPPHRVMAPPSVPNDRVRDPAGPRTMGPGALAASTTGEERRSTPARRSAESHDPTITPGPVQTHGGTHSGATGEGVSTTGGGAQSVGAIVAGMRDAEHLEPAEASGSIPPATAWMGERSPASVEGGGDFVAPPPAEDPLFPVVLGPNDAMRVIASAIASRTTGSLCIAAPEAERRVVLREGDVVTIASTSEEESLLAFLGVRGDLPRETVRRLGAKFPPFGRHAGAALVARGYLRQDQMWPTLRAHAEWLLARAMQAPSARLAVESQPPGRLAGEPGVFGGATGAEVFVEIVRRIVPHEEAINRLGGLGSRVADGPEGRLLGECALGAVELDQVHAAKGRSVRDVLDEAPEGDLATVLYALALLGVIEVLPAVGDGASERDQVSAAQVAAIDADAVRETVRARLQIVEDGDYFALLGVARDATGYEVRRAFLELRRAFEPTRILTPEVADLAPDVRKITDVLEEAYEILKDSARRERYRQAIEELPAR
jgi:hypothetical protein